MESNNHTTSGAIAKLLRASNSQIWLNCPGSVSLSYKIPEPPTSEWAEEGTIAHKLAEHMIINCLHFLNEEKFHAWLNTLPEAIGADPEMIAFCLSYVRVIEEELAKFDNFPDGVSCKTEARLTFDAEKQMTCTSDFVSTGQKGKETCGLVVDLKYGQGVPVTAKGNPQLAFYMCCLLKNSKKKLDRVKGIIVQPRMEEWYSEVEYSASELRTWHSVFLEAAQRALEQFLKKESSVVFTAGDHCRWCRAKGVCSTHMQWQEAKTGLDFLDKKTREIDLVPMLSPESMSRILEADKGIRAFLDAVYDRAATMLLNGEEVPGYKVVEGRSNRRWKGKEWENVVKTLGIDPFELKPKSVATLEKEIGKANFSGLEPYIEKPPGKPSVVPIDDKRGNFDVSKDFVPDYGELVRELEGLDKLLEKAKC